MGKKPINRGKLGPRRTIRSQEEVAQILGITYVQVRYAERSAMKKFREQLADLAELYFDSIDDGHVRRAVSDLCQIAPSYSDGDIPEGDYDV